jgi:error-prone DNA polymerase
MTARGYPKDFAERCFNQIKGFGEYGFPESHAASFAHLVYVSAWIKYHYPGAFAAALLNAQPMGFYAPAQIVRCAVNHGVEGREVDVNHSFWDCTLEPTSSETLAFRLGMRQIDGLREEDANRIVEMRGAESQFQDVRELWRRSGVSRACLERLAAADAFRSIGLDRRQALWEVRGLPKEIPLPLFEYADAAETGADEPVTLPIMPLAEHVVNDYRTLRLSLKAHPMSFLRERAKARRILSCADLKTSRDGSRVSVAGVVLVRQRPGSAAGVVFMTIEDETGVANSVIWPKVLERERIVVMGARLVVVHGRVQRHEVIIHVVAEWLEDRSDWLHLLNDDEIDVNISIANADEVKRPDPGWQPSHDDIARPLAPAAHVNRPLPSRERSHPRCHPRAERIVPKSRDFH